MHGLLLDCLVADFALGPVPVTDLFVLAGWRWSLEDTWALLLGQPAIAPSIHAPTQEAAAGTPIAWRWRVLTLKLEGFGV